MSTVEEILCRELPGKFQTSIFMIEPFCKFLKYSKELEYDEKPDYKRLRHEFRMLFMDIYNHNDSFSYDWVLKKRR